MIVSIIKPNRLIILLLYLAVCFIYTYAAENALKNAREAEQAGDIPLAISEYYRYMKEYNDKAPKEKQKEYADIFKHAGDLSQGTNRFIEALEFYTLAYQAADHSDYDAVLISSLGNIGNIYATFEDYNRAMIYYDRVYDEALKSDSRELQTKALINLVTASSIIGNPEKAKESFQKLKMIETPDSPEMAFHSNRIQGLMASMENNRTGAIFYFKQARANAEENHLDSVFLANQDLLIGTEYLQEEMTDSALHYLDRSLEIAKKNGYNEVTLGIYEELEEISRLNKDSVAETKYKVLIKQLTDSLYNRREFNTARNRLMEYEEKIQANKISNLSTRLSILWIIVGGVALLLLVTTGAALIITRRNRELKYANEALLNKNHELIRNEERIRELRDRYLASRPNSEERPGDMEENLGVDEQAEGTETNVKESAELPEEITGAKDSQSPYLNHDQIDVLLKRINKVLDDNEEIYNPEFSLNVLARKVKSNTKYVSWVINDSYGCNFKTLVNERRVREASRRLEDREKYGHMTIQSIAESVGFGTAASFIQAFKKVVGMTPSVYQKLASQNQNE